MTCKDCIHFESCERMISSTSKMFKAILSEVLKKNCDIKYDSTNILSGAEFCQCFQDRSRFVELPEVGNTIFEINKINSFGDYRIQELKVSSRIIDTNGVAFEINLLGKRFFLTREEAEQAIEREKNEALGA